MFTRENGAPSGQNAAVPAVVKAFRLLGVVSESPEALGVSELARRLGMGKSTVYGLVTTLRDVGALEADSGAKRYRIGRGLTALAMRSVGGKDVRAAARPHLERLAATTQQTSCYRPEVPYFTTLTVNGYDGMSACTGAITDARSAGARPSNSVTIGISELRITWTQMTRLSGRPLAKAVRT